MRSADMSSFVMWPLGGGQGGEGWLAYRLVYIAWTVKEAVAGVVKIYSEAGQV